jgi:hypothetical protein
MLHVANQYIERGAQRLAEAGIAAEEEAEHQEADHYEEEEDIQRIEDLDASAAVVAGAVAAAAVTTEDNEAVEAFIQDSSAKISNEEDLYTEESYYSHGLDYTEETVDEDDAGEAEFWEAIALHTAAMTKARAALGELRPH